MSKQSIRHCFMLSRCLLLLFWVGFPRHRNDILLQRSSLWQRPGHRGPDFAISPSERKRYFTTSFTPHRIPQNLSTVYISFIYKSIYIYINHTYLSCPFISLFLLTSLLFQQAFGCFCKLFILTALGAPVVLSSSQSDEKDPEAVDVTLLRVRPGVNHGQPTITGIPAKPARNMWEIMGNKWKQSEISEMHASPCIHCHDVFYAFSIYN